MTSLKEIEKAISKLTPQEYDELLAWLGDHMPPQPIDAQLKADLEAGRMDDLIDRAVEDYKAGRMTPLWTWLQGDSLHKRNFLAILPCAPY